MSYLPQVIDARYCDGFRIHLRFSDGEEGVGEQLLASFD